MNFGLKWAQTDVTGGSGMAENPQNSVIWGEISLGRFWAGPIGAKLDDLTRIELIKRRKCSERWNFAIMSTRVRPERLN